MGLALPACSRDPQVGAAPTTTPSGPEMGDGGPSRAVNQEMPPLAEVRGTSTAEILSSTNASSTTATSSASTGPGTSTDSEPETSGAHETGNAEEGDAEEGDAEEGDTGAGGPTSARLCSRPYTLSGTPGKGASRGGKSSADYAEATARLRRGFDVAVDGGERQRWSSKEGIEIDGLDPSRRHTVKISAADGKRVRKLVLDFRARGSDDLCLGFDDFYNTWQLRKLRSGRRCGPCVTR